MLGETQRFRNIIVLGHITEAIFHPTRQESRDLPTTGVTPTTISSLLNQNSVMSHVSKTPAK